MNTQAITSSTYLPISLILVFVWGVATLVTTEVRQGANIEKIVEITWRIEADFNEDIQRMSDWQVKQDSTNTRQDEDSKKMLQMINDIRLQIK